MFSVPVLYLVSHNIQVPYKKNIAELIKLIIFLFFIINWAKDMIMQNIPPETIKNIIIMSAALDFIFLTDIKLY